MCEQCVVNPFYYGYPITENGKNKLFLIRARREGDIMELKEWGLGFINDPFAMFKVTPRTNWKITKEDKKHLFEEIDKFKEELQNTIYIDDYYNFILALNGSDQFKDFETLLDNTDDTDDTESFVYLCYLHGWVGKLYYIIAKHLETCDVDRDEHDEFASLDATRKHDYNFYPKE